MNAPSSDTLNLPPRFGLIQRLFIVAAVLAVETVLLSGLIQNAPLDSLTGAPKFIHELQHWVFRYIIAYAMSFAILLCLRSAGALAAMSAAARDAPIRVRWLLAHAALLGLFAFLSGALYSGGLLPFAAVATAWHLCGLAAALALFAALAPLRVWIDFLRWTGALPLYALLPAAGALLAYKASQLLWAPAAALTFHLVRLLLHPFLATLRSDASTLTLTSGDFAVQISQECSGLEGVGLMLAFCVAWLWYYRSEYIFPRALIIIPGAVLLIFLLNVARIAALMLIGDAGYERVAIVGFHSQAGWIAFNLAAFCVAIAVKRSSWLNRSAQAVSADQDARAASNAGAAASAGAADATAAYLLPLLAILASGMIVHALSEGFDLFYPVRLVCAAIVLWAYRRSYRGLDWRFSWRGVAVGAATFCLWAAFAHFLSTPAAQPLDLAKLPPSLRVTWIACRAAAAMITVPIAEELAYRGYLMRRIVSRHFDRLPMSAVSVPALAISAAAFGAAHGGLWPAGVAAGLAYGMIAKSTGKIGESIAAHATTNALIAAQVLLFGQWQLW
ncbi:MAG: exosortase E/protease, VPEID-CTERM system [Steroidobacteraceae bacterium]